ncbi:hypothetical protein RUM44_001914 [Polyplax serrata]|uniref:Uncharacterized protein n=1 Tax=Polyplax serrata TaxID=468196 RepID=A0ABR1ALE0_POLSC
MDETQYQVQVQVFGGIRSRKTNQTEISKDQNLTFDEIDDFLSVEKKTESFSADEHKKSSVKVPLQKRHEVFDIRHRQKTTARHQQKQSGRKIIAPNFSVGLDVSSAPAEGHSSRRNQRLGKGPSKEANTAFEFEGRNLSGSLVEADGKDGIHLAAEKEKRKRSRSA